MTVTVRTYAAFQTAYDFFNRELFAGSLPHVMVTFQRMRGAFGYFAPDSFAGRGASATAHELAMNPDHFKDHSDGEIMSTLVHEMAHVWQEVHGKPSRSGYHNREWSGKMLDIGLNPSDTGKPGGKTTGQNMMEYVIKGGPFDQARSKLAGQGFRLEWESANPPEHTFARKAKKKDSKTKYTCPTHRNFNVWAKPGAAPVCPYCFPKLPTMMSSGGW